MSKAKNNVELTIHTLVIHFTALQQVYTKQKHVRALLKQVCGGLMSSELLDRAASDTFRGGHRDAIRFTTTNDKVAAKAVKYLQKIEKKKGCFDIMHHEMPACFHEHKDLGANFAKLSMDY